ncbi:hypothetical protein N2W54_000209 [Lotmaria passim]
MRGNTPRPRQPRPLLGGAQRVGGVAGVPRAARGRGAAQHRQRHTRAGPAEAGGAARGGGKAHAHAGAQQRVSGRAPYPEGRQSTRRSRPEAR